MGFPAAQISTLQAIRAESVLCIENLTTFHQQVDRYTGKYVNNGTRKMQHTVICTYGNPSPAIRRFLRLLPEDTPVYLWSDLDYGGFNILSQLRRTVNEQVQPFLMDIDTLEANITRASPLTVSDKNNLKRLLLRLELRDIRPVIEHMLERNVKLEQEGVEEF
jgi:DNA topoisomerase VI subunit A